MRLIRSRQIYRDSLQSTLYWNQNNGDLYSYYEDGEVLVFQNGNKLVEGVHYDITQRLNDFDIIEISANTHFNGADYEIIAIMTI